MKNLVGCCPQFGGPILNKLCPKLCATDAGDSTYFLSLLLYLLSVSVLLSPRDFLAICLANLSSDGEDS